MYRFSIRKNVLCVCYYDLIELMNKVVENVRKNERFNDFKFDIEGVINIHYLIKK